MILLVLVGVFSGLSTMMIGRSRKLSFFVIAFLVLGPVIDAIIAYWILEFCQISGLTLWIGAVCFGLLSHVLMQPLSVPQRLVVWRLAKENILRRKRQAALLMIGLIKLQQSSPHH